MLLHRLSQPQNEDAPGDDELLGHLRCCGSSSDTARTYTGLRLARRHIAPGELLAKPEVAPECLPPALRKRAR
jgi:hypothetical protein